MKVLYSVVFVVFSLLPTVGQEQIDDSFSFQTDPEKAYSIYLPSAYEEGTPIAAFLALHPWNTDRWNAQTWCEEMASFAEANDVILICPDGGEDGKIDDPIDTAFTSVLLDSAFLWYDIDPSRLYAIGFSWGGKTTYTYGLNHIDRFAGLLPIGAAVSIAEVDGISDNAVDVPIYVVHGSLDSPNTRFHPLVSAMEDSGACVESNLLSGVGHTIDFSNQVEILSDAYSFLRENECTTTSVENEVEEQVDLLASGVVIRNTEIMLNREPSRGWIIYDMQGAVVLQGVQRSIIIGLPSGRYIIQMGSSSQEFIVIQM